MNHTTMMVLIMAVPLVTWLGVFTYVMGIDRTLRRLESDEKEKDDL